MGRKISICETVPSERRERRGRLRRIFDAVMEARQRDAERDIRCLIGCSDGPLSRRSVENSRLVIAAVFIVLLPIGEAALFRARGEDDA